MSDFVGVICGEKHFSVGSPFSISIEGNPSSHKAIAHVHVTSGATLRISTATVQDKADRFPLMFSSSQTKWKELSLCHFGKDLFTHTALGIDVSGPYEFKLLSSSQINVFGSVVPSTSSSSSPVVPTETLTLQQEEKGAKRRKIDDDDSSDKNDANKKDKKEESTTNTTKQEDKGSNKRKIDDDHESSDKNDANNKKEKKEEFTTSTTNSDALDVAASNENNTDDTTKNESNSEEPPVVKLSKKERKKLAKQKAKELAEAVDKNQGREPKTEEEKASEKSKKDEKKKKSLPITRERRMAGGLKVRDIIIGDGLPVKSGRKVSILYEGAFTNGDVFDRNQNKGNPLTFRPGTGAVIRGLEKGIEGMKVGGERIITIPPALGYGKKGQGHTIPSNSTLVFTVQLLDVGGR